MVWGEGGREKGTAWEGGREWGECEGKIYMSGKNV